MSASARLARLLRRPRRRGARGLRPTAMLLLASLATLAACTGLRGEQPWDASTDGFTIAMIPDTQNYVDYTHQQVQGFPIDASALFIAQMQWIAERAVTRGGDIAFVAAVGDVWQHQSEPIEAAHAARGLDPVENPFFGGHFDPTPKVHEIEIPQAIEGYRRIAEAGLPFGVAPGNHDYDAMWTLASYPPNLDKPRRELSWTAEDIGMLHVGGLDNFRSAFGADSAFFAGKSWYVDAFRGGANSAQVFEAGGYRFLHLALEMHADDEVVAWAEGVLARHPGLPTILSTHDYLDPRGERRANPIIDLARADPDFHNSADQLFEELIWPNDQIFLVLCGHHHGQAFRVDMNEAGHAVYQMLADYQDRGQAGLDAGAEPDPMMGGRPIGIGDGWLRLLSFELGGDAPRLRVRTWSTHYETFSRDLPSYADWYRAHEQPEMSDAEFHAAEAFVIPLEGFRERFGVPAR